MSYIKYKNQKVYYRITGKGQPLLLLHGNTASSAMFSSILKKYKREFKVILIDFPGHGKSEKVKEFETDFWYYNSEVCYSLIMHLGLTKVSVAGTSGGALIAINLALEHPEYIQFLIADSFEGEYPLPSYIETIQSDREKDKRKLMAKLFWFYCHGIRWRKIVDMDTKVNIEFAQTGRSFFHKPISELKVPTLITGSLKDEYCSNLDEIYSGLKRKNESLEIHLFEKGNHPAMISNKEAFLELLKDRLKDSK